MSQLHDVTPAVKRRRRRRRRKAPVAVVPLASSEAGPAEPGPIEQPAVHPVTGGQYYPGRDTRNPPPSGPRNVPDPLEDEDDGAPLRPGKRKAERIVVDVPARSHEILTWAAEAAGMPFAAYVTQVLASVAASMRPEYRRAKTGSTGGSVRARDLGRFTE